MFLSAKPPSAFDRAKPAILVVASLLIWALILRINYLNALHWAGVMTPEAIGYMFGACLSSVLIGFLAMFITAKVRGKKSAPATRIFGVSVVAFLVSFVSFAGSLKEPPHDAKHDVGDLLRQAAGNKLQTADVNWWDGPTRDLFRDLIARNQQYIDEIHARDSSAIKNLYSPDSYAGKVHMEKVISQLRAQLDVETKYASVEPILQKMKDRIATAHASEDQKRDFLKGMEESVGRSMKPRTDLILTEKVWMDTTLALYEFMIAHSSDYSIRDTKLYFSNDAVRKEFVSSQTKAVAAHNDFLKAKASFDDMRKNNLGQLGVSSTEFTPSQLGKAH